MRITVRVPATVANLGPGFDCFALALDVVNEVTLDTAGEPGVMLEGEGAGELPQDGSNLIPRSMEHLARDAGVSLPSFSLSCANRIPLERGLGSSAAAVVAGLALADRLLGTELSKDRLLEMAVDVEGHPDNVAAALRGGLVLAYRSRGGWRAESLVPSPDLRPVVLIPKRERLATSEARRALPHEVSLSDAVFNVGRAALAVVAMTARPDLLAEALEDRLHQPHRLPLTPAVHAVFLDLKDSGIPVCVAGAGPSLLAFESEGVSVPDLGPDWRALRLRPRAAGVEVA